MANRYGEAALYASHPDRHHPKATPLDRWNEATRQLYPTSPTQQKKGSPKGAFLGLCEAGWVKGIPPGQYTGSNKHKTYAIRAIELLLDGTAERSVPALWRQVTEGEDVPHSSQMDVVMALWKNDRIVRPVS
jgi:hypothetical protein